MTEMREGIDILPAVVHLFLNNFQENFDNNARDNFMGSRTGGGDRLWDTGPPKLPEPHFSSSENVFRLCVDTIGSGYKDKR
jgi:hypothetical protein